MLVKKNMFKSLNKGVFKISLSGIILFSGLSAYAESARFVSISPAMTEIMFSIGAGDILFGVSDYCKYPKEAENKEKIGSGYFINEEKILKLRPRYILALDSSSFMLNKFKRFNIQPVCFKYPDIESVFENILTIGKMTGKEDGAKNVVNFARAKISLAKEQNKNPGRKILYLTQARPMITAGSKSFINDIIEKSGNISATKSLKSNYPVILEEFAISLEPDVVVLSFYCNENEVRKFFPKTKIVKMTMEENDIINRPGPRIYKAVEFFAKL